MTFDFSAVDYKTYNNLNGGEGTVLAKVIPNETGMIMSAVIPAGSSIGLHTHQDNMDYNFVVSGQGLAICDGVEEELKAGSCHICYMGSTHMIKNTGAEDLVINIAVVNKI